MPQAGKMKDPFGAFNFLVEIEGIIKAGFTSVSGLDISVEFDTVREGGVNDFEYKLPKGLKYSDITLKNGLTDWELWDWCQDFALGKSERKSGSIHLLDDSGNQVMSWNFIDAYPTKWNGPSLDATKSAVATESLVLAHHGLFKG
jgi:phage tail-like protein